jgi:hypothetical protein
VGRQAVAGSGRKNADDRLALELAAGRTVTESAEAAGIGERTAYRRLEDPAFRRLVSELRRQMVDVIVGRLVDASTRAVKTLNDLLTAESESVRLGAARSILELGTKFRQLNELEERISELEARSHGVGIADQTA